MVAYFHRTIGVDASGVLSTSDGVLATNTVNRLKAYGPDEPETDGGWNHASVSFSSVEGTTPVPQLIQVASQVLWPAPSAGPWTTPETAITVTLGQGGPWYRVNLSFQRVFLSQVIDPAQQSDSEQDAQIAADVMKLIETEPPAQQGPSGGPNRELLLKAATVEPHVPGAYRYVWSSLRVRYGVSTSLIRPSQSSVLIDIDLPGDFPEVG